MPRNSGCSDSADELHAVIENTCLYVLVSIVKSFSSTSCRRWKLQAAAAARAAATAEEEGDEGGEDA